MSNIRIQDDLYRFVNQEWIDNAVIPADRPTTGGFADLALKVEEIMINELKSLDASNTPTGYAVKLFNIANDVKRRNKEGIRPILKTLKGIDKISNVSSLNRNLKEFVVSNLPLPFKLSVDVNMKDTSKYSIYVQGPSVILPDTKYYQDEMKAQYDSLISIWKNMALDVLSYSKLDKSLHEEYVNNCLSFDKRLASLVKSNEEWSEYTKMYNPIKTSKVSRLLKPLKFKKLLTTLFEEVPEEIIVAEPRYLNGFSSVFSEETFNEYKCWAYVTELVGDASLLSEKIRNAASSFNLALQGVDKVQSIEKQAYNLASAMYSEPLGMYYGDKYFGRKAKEDVVDMVHEIINAYKERMTKNDFLSEETKKKAILKLSTMEVKMGYPDKYDSLYDSLVFDDSSSLFDVMTSLTRIKKLHELNLLNEKVDRTKWVMPGHMVNACYNPFTNDITFPAAILQAPFYSIEQTRSQNLGGIGAVIGHEISHAFDNNGAMCDENGNLNNWWTKEDFKKFNQKTKAMIKQFDGIELPWGVVNGTFIVSENIADNGGMAVTLDIMSKMREKSYEQYFINWAKVWCMKAKEEYLKLLLQVDVHGPVYLRGNMPPRNFKEWYETFDVKKTDKMYIPENKRVVIW